MKVNFGLLLITYWLVSFIFAIYSYSQIDLNLTLSSNAIYQNLQKQLIWLGYFNRPLSALIYLILILLFFIFYFLIFNFTSKGKLTINQLWFLIIGNFVILLLSYPAFSHDIFNYIFDARILIHYQVNPWTHTALDFPQDLWIRFMHWTHRTYPYGPFWLVATIVPYVLGMGKFVLTLFNFKLLMGFSYLGSCYLITKIVKKLTHKNQQILISLAFFALNPLVLTETLLSPHLDIFMTFLGLLAILFMVERKRILGGIFLLLSFLTKYITLSYSPIIFEKIKLEKRLISIIGLTAIAILAQIISREILPWYFIPLIAVVALQTNNIFFQVIIFGISMGGNLYYLPYLYIGEFNDPVKIWRLCLFFIPVLLSILIGFWQYKEILWKNEKREL